MSSSALIVFVDPRQVEIDQLLAGLQELRQQVMAMTLNLENLKAEIFNVEREYHSRLSESYRELEETRLSTQEFGLRLRLIHEGVIAEEIESRVVACFKTAREQLEKKNLSDEPDPRPTSASNLPLTADEKRQLQQIYLKLAKDYHPDKSGSDSIFFAQNIEMMTRVNRAYEEQDLQTLCRIQEGTADPTHHALDNSNSIDKRKRKLIRTMRYTKQLINGLNVEVARVKASEGYQLKTRFEVARKNSTDLFRGLVRDMQRKVNRARHHLDTLRQQFNHRLQISSKS